MAGSAQRYVVEFEAKWLPSGRPADTSPLGSKDIESLGELSTSLDALRSTRVVPITRQAITLLVAATLIPIAPLLLTVIPAEELAKHLLKLVIERDAPLCCREIARPASSSAGRRWRRAPVRDDEGRAHGRNTKVSSESAWWSQSLEEIDREVARLATLCRVKLSGSRGVIERVHRARTNSVCGIRNEAAFGKLRDALMMHYHLRDKAVDALGEIQAVGDGEAAWSTGWPTRYSDALGRRGLTLQGGDGLAPDHRATRAATFAADGH